MVGKANLVRTSQIGLGSPLETRLYRHQRGFEPRTGDIRCPILSLQFFTHTRENQMAGFCRPFSWRFGSWDCQGMFSLYILRRRDWLIGTDSQNNISYCCGYIALLYTRCCYTTMDVQEKGHNEICRVSKAFTS